MLKLWHTTQISSSGTFPVCCLRTHQYQMLTANGRPDEQPEEEDPAEGAGEEGAERQRPDIRPVLGGGPAAGALLAEHQPEGAGGQGVRLLQKTYRRSVSQHFLWCLTILVFKYCNWWCICQWYNT